MFSKSDKPTSTDSNTPPAPAPAAAPKAAGVPSIISSDLKVVGDLESDGDLQIDGNVEGDVRSKNVIIGESAHIKGQISADTVRVCGRVDGEVRADKVVLMKTAQVTGDIVHKSLSIEAGSSFEGNCRRMEAGAGKAAGSDKVQALKPSPAGNAQPAAG